MKKIKHLAVIMDGNRRWAKSRNLPTIEGHRAGVQSLKNLVKLCHRLDIEYLTVYAFSTENWKREKTELDFLFKLLAQAAIGELSSLKSQNVRVKFLGDISAFKDVNIYQPGHPHGVSPLARGEKCHLRPARPLSGRGRDPRGNGCRPGQGCHL